MRLLPGMGARDMAIDLGTANTLVYVRNQGIVASEPSVVAIDTMSGAVHAVGAEAKRMIGRTPATITAIRPLRHGVIADFEVTEQMLRYFLRKVERKGMGRPRLMMCAPSGVTEVEQRAIIDASLAAGARQVHLIEEPIAAAIGAGIAIEEPVGNMVVDVGGGTSEVAVISLGGIVISTSLRVGGYELDEAISAYVRRRHGLAIGERTAEDIKLEIGSAHPLPEELMMEVRGRELVSGLPRTLALTSEEVREALADPVEAIVGAVKETLEQTPPELAADIGERGIVLAGGSSLLHGFKDRLREETGMPVEHAESPLTAVAVGSGLALEEFDALARGNKVASRRKPRARAAYTRV
jgi:rod shape-determining protein MreB